MNNGGKDKSGVWANKSEKIALLSLFSISSLPEDSNDSGDQRNHEKHTRGGEASERIKATYWGVIDCPDLPHPGASCSLSANAESQAWIEG